MTGVATQGRRSSNANQWVTKYKLQYSDDETSFKYYREPGQASDKVQGIIMEIGFSHGNWCFFFSSICIFEIVEILLWTKQVQVQINVLPFAN